MFRVGGLFMKQNAHGLEGRIEEGRVATPISFSIFDFYDMKSLHFHFSHDIFISLKWQALKVGMPIIQPLNKVKLKALV